MQQKMTTTSNLLSFLIKTEDEDPWSEDEDTTTEMESCKRLCLEESVSDEVNMDDITEITVTLSDSEDLLVNGNVPAGDSHLQGSETVTFEQIFETQSDLPMCWTEDQANYFRTQNPWLQIRNGRLGCAVCIEVGALSLHQHVRGSRLAREWLQFLIGSTSITKKGQQSALRKKIWEHRESHAHQQAEKVLLQAQAGLFDLPAAQTRNEEHEITCRIFRTAYMISKLNRPFSDMPDLVELQVANGADMGRVLHSRKSCAEICDFIGEEMKKKIIGYMIEKDVKFSVLVEECTTVNNKSAMAVSIRAAFGEESEPLTIFFQLLELQEMTDESITTELQCCLHEHFPMDFIARSWVSFTADGASATMNWASGVASLLNMSECYPTLVIWHCCNHRLELTVAEALEEVTGAHSFKVFIDMVYCLYQITPKNQRELHTCAEEFAILLKATNKVLDTRMVASSCRTVTAVWNKYPALCAHFKAAVADLKRSNTEKAKYKSLVERLTSVEFVKNLGVMRDALKMLSELSLRLQVNSITLPEAHILICQQIQVFMELAGGKQAEFTKIALQSATNLKFQGVLLNSEQKVEVEINKESFFQSLSNCLQSRLMTSSARAASSSEEVSFSEFDDLFPACKVLYPQYWPEDADFQYGENEVLSLCQRFQLPAQQIVQGFREYKASGGGQIPEQLRPLLTTLKTIAISSSECERVFTDMNNTITSVRSSLQISRVSNLLFLQRNGPPLAEFHPESYVAAWLAQGRHSAYHLACRERDSKDEVTDDDKKYLWSLF